MTKKIDKPLALIERKLNSLEEKMTEITKNLEGHKKAYNALTKSLTTLKKMPD
ncbi:MAG: hypothetical protein AAF442_04690 [Pseudomonadota bacterium]